MKGDFTRFTHRPEKHYTRVLKQQGRVDLDADWNESEEISTHLERTEAIDVIGRCGVPIHGGGFDVEIDSGALTISRGRIYVDGILCSNESEDASDPIPIGGQPDLPDYAPPLEEGDGDGVYLAYLDVWDRHVTYIEDPDIREVALGGPDTTTRTRTLSQVKLEPLGRDAPLDTLACVPFAGRPATGRLAAKAESADEPSNPCVVPAAAGYRGLENRLYRVEIHDDGRVTGAPTFKWSRDNGSVVLPIAENGIDGDEVTVKRLGPDEVLTVNVGHWVEVLGDATELYGRHGTLAQIEPDGIDKADLEITLSADVSSHDGEEHPKMRRWDHQATDDVALVDGALPIQGTWFELEDGVQVRFDTTASYHVGDYWMIPARTRQGTVLWPEEGNAAAERPRLGIEHHYCTLALVRRQGGTWTEARDCRRHFPPLTEVSGGCCCIRVAAGESVQHAVDTVAGQGGGCVILCRGVHRIEGPLWLGSAKDVTLRGESAATVLRFDGVDEAGDGGIVVESGERIAVEDLFVMSDSVPALVTVRNDDEWTLSRQVALRRLLMLNLAGGSGNESGMHCAVRLAHVEGVVVEECRIAAEVGIASLWGDALPDPTPIDVDEVPDSEMVVVEFEQLPLGDEIRVGDTVTDSGVEITGEEFFWGNGQSTADGFAEVENEGRAGGSGQDVEVNNINLSFAIPSPYAAVRVTYRDFGGNVNLRVNGELRNAGTLSSLDGEVVGGVRVGIDAVAGVEGGSLRLDEDSAPIGDFAIGGQEFWIDDVIFRGAAEPLPERPELEYGAGVSELEMRDSHVRYRDYGVLALRSERWEIDGCEIESFDEAQWPLSQPSEAERSVERDRAGAAAAGTESRHPYAGLRAALEDFLATAPVELRGTAIQAFLWRDCYVRQSRLAGARGIEAWWWMGGGAIGNRVASREHGLLAFWLQEVDWRSNRIVCDDGPAAAFVGCNRPAMVANRTRGDLGCVKLPFRHLVRHLHDDHLSAAVRAYGHAAAAESQQRVLWLFLEESAAVVRLTWLVDGLQAVVDAFFEFAQDEAVQDNEDFQALFDWLGWELPFENPPAAVLYWLATKFRVSLLEFLQNPEEAPLWARLGPVIPVIAPTIANNDMRSDGDTVLLEQFLPLGGMWISDNRLDSLYGQTVRVNAWPYASNVSVVERIARLLPEALEYLRGVFDSVADWEPDDPNVRDAWEPVKEALAWLFRGDGAMASQILAWKQRMERLFGTDFRIAGNTLRSLNTAIETNLFEIAILRNHVTMRERPIFNHEIVKIVEKLREFRTLEPVGSLVQGGDVNGVAYFPRALKKKETIDWYLDDQPTYQRTKWRAGGAVAAPNPEPEISGRVVAEDFPSAVEADAMRFEIAVEAGDLNQAVTVASELSERLELALNSFGIWAKGAGVRIVGNHVLVPDDAEEDTWARGGIRLQGDDEVNLMILLLGVLGELVPGLDPLLGVTETVIEGNELIGGVGNGIDILEISGGSGSTAKARADEELEDILPFQALFDLRVRGNQIRGTGGCGLSIDAATFAIDVEIDDNLFIKCANDRETARFGQSSGGIDISTAALCRLRGNQINRCGDLADAGIRLRDILGLTLSDNLILRSGRVGGVVLQTVLGHAEVCDNQFLFNPSTGLLWDNSILRRGHAKKWVVTDLKNLAFLAYLFGVYLGPNVKDDVLATHVQIEDNLFRSKVEASKTFSAFDLYLASGRLILSGNSCFGTSNLGAVSHVSHGVVTGNLFETPDGWSTLVVNDLSRGVITGNVCSNNAISLTNPGGAVQHGLNVPPII